MERVSKGRERELVKKRECGRCKGMAKGHTIRYMYIP